MQPARAPAWPAKTRELLNHHMQSTRWNDFKFRDDDVVIATYGKSGTTWMQQIVGQLIFNGREDVDIHDLSPWVDLRIIPQEAIDALEHQTHRRFIKTHLPVDALVFSPKAKYIYIGRDGRDAAWSLFNHHINATDDYFTAFNETPGRVGPRLERGEADVVSFYRNWISGDGFPYWPFWENILSWWNIRNLPNVMLIHFDDMKADLPSAVRRIADHLDIAADDALINRVTAHSTFEFMKANATRMAPRGGVMWNGGATTFINKGTNGRWRDHLSAAEATEYERLAVEKLGKPCAAWLAQGGVIPS